MIVASQTADRHLARISAHFLSADRAAPGDDGNNRCGNEKARSTRALRPGKLLLSLQFAVSHLYFVADLVLGRFVVRERT